MKDKMIFWMGTTSIVGLIGWCTFITQAVAKIPNIESVKEMIVLQSPYVADKKVIALQIARSESMNEKLADTLDRNTEAINQLRIELARIVAAREKGDKEKYAN